MRRLSLTMAVLCLFALGAALAGCRTEPGVAAYVEDTSISTDDLAAAVEARMADANVAAVVDPADPDYRRMVLSQLVQQAIYRLIGDSYDISVGDQQVADKLDELLSGDTRSPEEVFAQLASEQMLAEIDVRENIRQALTREQIAAREGLDGPTMDPALLARYEEIKDQLSMVELGYLTVPDQATADDTLAAILADPGGYPALAATYAGPYTQPELLSSPLTEVPGPLIESVLAAGAGAGFTLALPETGGVIVGYVAALRIPAFEEVRGDLRAEAAGGVDAAAAEIVKEFTSGLDVDVNPRYGTLDPALGRVVPDEGGVVRILEDVGASRPATP